MLNVRMCVILNLQKSDDPCMSDKFLFIWQAFHNPAEFTVVLTGAISEEMLLPLVEQYLAAIPATTLPQPLSLRDVAPLPFSFPSSTIEEDVKCVNGTVVSWMTRVVQIQCG